MTPKILIILSLIWQGATLEEANLDALRSFRLRNANIPVQHFVSPAYFLSDIPAKTVRAKFHGLYDPTSDELGLALVGWKSLARAAGVAFRSLPTFWGNQLTPQSCQKDCGLDVSVAAYSDEELYQIMQANIGILVKNQFPQPTGMMVNGWMLTRSVAHVAARSGIKFDFSAVATELLEPKIKDTPLFSWAQQMWQGIGIAFKPYTIATEPEQFFYELGNAGAMADYLDVTKMSEVFSKVANAAKTENETFVFNVGIHQETAAEFLPRIEEALPIFQNIAARDGVAVEYVVIPKRWTPESGKANGK